MSVYKVLTNLKHDGAFFKAGEKIILEDKKVAKNLIQDEVIEELNDEELKDDKPKTPAEKKAEKEKATKKDEAETQEPGEESDEDEETEETDESDEEETNESVYSEMSNADLKKLCKERGIEVASNATKQKLIEALESSDESEEL